MLFNTQAILEIDLLVETIGIVVLLGILVSPSATKKQKVKARGKFIVNRDTRDAEYAINEQGHLEKINWPDAHNH